MTAAITALNETVSRILWGPATLLLFLAVWVLRRLGVSFETEALAEAHILRIFTANTPLDVISLLQ